MSSSSLNKFSPWPFALLLFVIATGTTQLFWGFPAMILCLAASALLLSVAVMWSSLQQMGQSESMSFEQALSYKAPSATEEQKRAALRTLKDLDYELHVGKISQEDFDLVSQEVRARAKQLIAQQDEDMGEKLELAENRVDLYIKKRKLDLAASDREPTSDREAILQDSNPKKGDEE